jgi:hypothetical protein
LLGYFLSLLLVLAPARPCFVRADYLKAPAALATIAASSSFDLNPAHMPHCIHQAAASALRSGAAGGCPAMQVNWCNKSRAHRVQRIISGNF